MTQEPAVAARSRAGVTPRLGAVLAACGPVILTSFGLGGQGLERLLLLRTNAIHDLSAPSVVEGPRVLENLPGDLLFWGVLLLPVVVAGLLLRGSRRAALAAVAAVGTVLASGLLMAFLVPGLDPDTGQERAATLPWPLIVCCPVAAGTLLLAARSPRPGSGHGIVLWAGAVAAAAWSAVLYRPIAVLDLSAPGLVHAETPESPLADLAWWSREADGMGLTVVLVTLAATVRTTASTRWGQAAGTAAAVALLLFPLLDVVTYLSEYGGDFQPSFADSVRWNLLLAAGLVMAATRGPGTSVSLAGTVHLARRLIHGRPGGTAPERTRRLAIAIVIAVAVVWLVVSSITPTR